MGILITLVLLDIYLLLDSRIFNINGLNIQLNNSNCTTENEIKNESQILGKKFFLLDKNKIEEKLKNKFSCIKFINLTKQIPNKVTIEVFGREPVAILSFYKSNESSNSALLENIASDSATATQELEILDQFLVDSEGVVFSKLKNTLNVPIIYFGSFDLSVGRIIGETLLKNSLKISEKIKTYDIHPKIAKMYPDNVFVIFPETEKPKLVFALERDIDIQLASLQLILTQAKIDEQDMEFVDLRFEKPVVKYIQKKK